MRNAARHLADRAEALLLHHLFLRRSQLIKCDLQVCACFVADLLRTFALVDLVLQLLVGLTELFVL